VLVELEVRRTSAPTVPHFVHTMRGPRGWHVSGPMIGVDDRLVVALLVPAVDPSSTPAGQMREALRRASRSDVKVRGPGSSCIWTGIWFEIVALAQHQRFVGATESSEDISSGSGRIPGPAMIFSEHFFVAGEGGFAKDECFGRATSRHKKARKIATYAICVWMLGADYLEGRQCTVIIRPRARQIPHVDKQVGETAEACHCQTVVILGRRMPRIIEQSRWRGLERGSWRAKYRGVRNRQLPARGRAADLRALQTTPRRRSARRCGLYGRSDNRRRSPWATGVFRLAPPPRARHGRLR
jgi:hypothetical protein